MRQRSDLLKSFFIWMGLSEALLATTSHLGTAKNNAQTNKPAGSSAYQNLGALEAKTQVEDKDAVTAFKASLSRLTLLTQKKANSREEPVLLAQTAEILKRMAAIQFRLVHRYPTNFQAELKEYQGTINQIIQIENKLIQRYPNSPDIARYYFLRASALKELGKDAEAIQNLKYVIDYYPKNDDIVNSQLTLYELLSKTKDYRTAIQYHSRLDKNTAGNYYPLVLNNLAFAYFYLNDIPTALHYLEQELSHYPARTDPGAEDLSERTKILKNCVLFYFTGMTNRLPNFTNQKLIPYFRSLNPGHSIGTMFKYLSNLLRSRGRDDDIEALLKSELLSSHLAFTDALDFVIMAFENELNRRDYVHLRETGDILNRLATNQTGIGKGQAEKEKIYKTLGIASLTLQQAYTKDQGTPAGDAIAGCLIYIYQTLLKAADNKSKEIKLHFNIAEIYYQQKKDYELASYHYSWIIDNWKSDPSTKIFYDQAQFKMIVARYEALTLKHTFPKEVVAQALDRVQNRAITPEAAQWVTWVDRLFQEKRLETLEIYMFEGSRLLYSHGQIKEAFQLLTHLIQIRPNSKFAIPAASLILDTYVASEKWDDANKQANEFLKKQDMTRTDPTRVEFRTRLQKVATDSYFKMVEVFYQQAHYPEAIRQADLFAAQYPNSPKRLDALAIAGNAALAMKDKQKALSYFSPLVKEKYAGKTLGTAFLTRGTSAEEHFDLDTAASEYVRYLSLPPTQRELPPKELDDLRVKSLFIAWSTGHPNVLKQVLGNPQVCTRELAAHCDKMNAYSELTNNGNTKSAFERWRKSRGPDKAVWATLILQNPKSIQLQERLQILETIAQDWEALDSAMKYTLLPYLSTSLVANLNQCGADVRRLSPLQLDKQHINNRAKWIEKMEVTLQKLLVVTWARIRAGSSNEWANLYANFGEDISALPRPKGMSAEEIKGYDATISSLVTPFSKKTTELRKKAFDIGMENGIESESFFPIATAAYRESAASFPPDLRPEKIVPAHKNLYVEAVKNSGIDPTWLTQLLQSIGERNFPKVSYLIQYAQGRKLLSPAQESLVRSLSLVVAGAQAEALDQFKIAAPKLEPTSKKFVLLAMVLGYYGVRAKEKTRRSIEEFILITGSSERRTLLSSTGGSEFFEAIGWSDANVPQETKEEISELKESSPSSPSEVNPE